MIRPRSRGPASASSSFIRLEDLLGPDAHSGSSQGENWHGEGRGPLSTYALAFAALAAAVLVRWLLDPLLGDTLPLVTLFGAVAAAVWVGGYRPALVIGILGYLACAYLFIAPRGRLGVGETEDVVGLFAYLFTCALIIGFGQAMRSARARASRQRELLRVTLRSIGDAVLTTDTEGRVTYLNEIAESLTGWTRADARGQPLATVFHIVNEATRQPVESPATRALREGVVVGLANHTVLLRKDGGERAIDDSAAPIRDEKGHVAGCVLIFRDTTAQRQAEAEREKLVTVLENSTDFIGICDLNGIPFFVNHAGLAKVGLASLEEARRTPVQDFFFPEDQPRIVTEFFPAVLERGHGEIEIRFRHFKTGAALWMAYKVLTLYDAAGKPSALATVSQDITERKRLEDDLRRLAADLSEADRRKDEFLAVLAHELRNPLAPMSNMLEVMKRAGNDTDMLARARETLERQLGQLVRLVDDLLDLNRITHNRLELRPSQVEIAAVIHQAVEAARPLLEAAGHELQLTLPAEPIYLHADPARLTQVFGNLLNNSCKYTVPGGTIRVTAERSGEDVVVTVEDTGRGIPANQLESIFEMFTQVDRSLERSQGGLGIGLTLVKRLVEMHGGSITARSAGEGRGSEFVVRLPLASGKAASPASTAAQEPAPARRILVVDDNEDSALSLALLLTLAGHTTETAHDGIAALEAAEQHRPEVVLLDIGLPKLNGYEVCRRIRAHDWGQDMVVIALTGWGQEDDRRKSQEAGFDGHLVKPVDHAALLALLTRDPRRPPNRQP